jgi:hypothetical protein
MTTIGAAIRIGKDFPGMARPISPCTVDLVAKDVPDVGSIAPDGVPGAGPAAQGEPTSWSIGAFTGRR